VKTVTLHEQTVEYELKMSLRSSRIRLAIYPGGRFVITIPKRMSESLIEKVVLEKADWILEKIAKMKLKASKEPVVLSKIERKRLTVVAQELVYRRLEYFNQYYQYTYHRVSFRHQKTRWGSCSREGNLNFNVKIALLPPHLADYIIVHELCHLKEMNHSERFWHLVAQTFPEHKTLRKELKQNYSAA